MKEIKVYVDDELLIYDDFSLCCTKNFDNTFYTNNYSLIDNEEYFEAYFQSIKSHDRELVKEVCEKIARNVRVRKIKKEWYAIETDLRAILDQIQQEFEDE